MRQMRHPKRTVSAVFAVPKRKIARIGSGHPQPIVFIITNYDK